MDEKVSVIVPIYNVEKYLRQCLDSIVNQTYKNLEIILIDDGSPDACGAICDKYAALDNRIVVIHKENAGVSAARNDGIERATGEWLMFVDPDDWLETDCCRKVLEVTKNNEFDIVFFQREKDDQVGRCIIKYPDVDSFQIHQEMIQAMRLNSYKGLAETLGFESMVPWAKLYRLEFLTENPCRFPIGIKKRQDVIFNLQCQEYLQKAYFYNYVGYHNRVNPESVCNRYNEEMLDIVLSYLHELMNLADTFHKNERLFITAIGVQSYNALSDVEKLLFFYPQKEVSYKEYAYQMKLYYGDETVKRCIAVPEISDFYSMGQKVRHYFISKHWLFSYYWIQRCYSAIKELTNPMVKQTVVRGGGTRGTLPADHNMSL